MCIRDRDIGICEIYIFFMVRLTGDIYNLPQNVGYTIELVGFLKSILYVYSDNNIGPLSLIHI